MNNKQRVIKGGEKCHNTKGCKTQGRYVKINCIYIH